MKPRQPRRPKRTKQAGILSQGTRSCKKFISDFFFLFEKAWCDLFFSFLYQEYQVQTCFSWVFFVLITNGMAFSSLEYLARLAANYHRHQPARKSLRPVNSRCFEKAAWRPAVTEFPSVDFRFDLQVLEAWTRNLWLVFCHGNLWNFTVFWKENQQFQKVVAEQRTTQELLKKAWIFSLKKRTTAAPATVSVWMMFFFLKSITGRLAIYINWLICFAVLDPSRP